MGLDMYASATREAVENAVDFTVKESSGLHYWRKHPNLHGWMEALYYEKGGSDTFNCTPMVLTSEDLDRLEADVRAANLPPTEGFFFGESDGSETEDDLAFIAKARKSLADGLMSVITVVDGLTFTISDGRKRLRAETAHCLPRNP